MLIQIKEHSIKFSFGLYFLGKAQSHYNTDLGGLLKSLKTNADIIDLMFLSAKTESYLDEKDFPITRREFVEYFINSKNAIEEIKKWELQFVEDIKGHFLPDNEDNKEDEVKKK